MKTLMTDILYACTVCTVAGIGTLAVVTAATLIWVLIL
jgi:hypothetical protein